MLRIIFEDGIVDGALYRVLEHPADHLSSGLVHKLLQEAMKIRPGEISTSTLSFYVTRVQPGDPIYYDDPDMSSIVYGECLLYGMVDYLWPGLRYLHYGNPYCTARKGQRSDLAVTRRIVSEVYWHD